MSIETPHIIFDEKYVFYYHSMISVIISEIILKILRSYVQNLTSLGFHTKDQDPYCQMR